MSHPAAVFPPTDVSAALLGELEIGPRARIVAASVAELVAEAAVVVFAIEEPRAPMWTAKAMAGVDINVDGGPIALDAGTLGAVAQARTVLEFRAEKTGREDYAHLDVRQNVTALSYVPLLHGEQLVGCIEIVSFAEPPGEETLAQIGEIAAVAAIGFATALIYAAERNAGLASVMRLTQLYDIEKVFNATLEMQSLLAVIVEKVGDLIRAGTVNLWMVDKEDLLLMQQAGEDQGAAPGDRQKAGDGVAGDVSESGEAALLQSEDEGLAQRNARSEDTAISVMAAPLLDGETLTGVLEAIRREGDEPFTEDDLFVLTQVAESAAQALHNSSLLEAERKIEVLQTLVSVGQEIGSTLNQQRVLQAIVDQPQLVIPYERAAIALEQKGRLTIQAISGVVKVDTSEPGVARLGDLLRWAAGMDSEIHVTQHGEEIDDSRPETREKFRRYFEESGSRGFFAIPLNDDEGRLGILSFESSDADFLTGLHIEVIKILSSQATLALRNASLYKEVPFIGILEPLIEKKRRFMAMDKRRRTLRIALVVAVVLILVLVPLPMRVAGDAQVGADQTQYVRAERDGVVQTVLVHEGERVEPGTPLAQMADWSERATLASVQARYNTSMAQMAQALVNNDATAAGQRQLEASYLRGELQRATDELERMTLRSEIAGVVATPHVENIAGQKLSLGDPVMELVSTKDMEVDVALPERDIPLVRQGDAARVKLESFPTQTFAGRVNVVSPAGDVVGDSRAFYARIMVPNTNGALRPGMQGYGKVRTGLRPLGYVLFRDTGLWLWSKLWGWFGW
ncbi:MAG TPA: efflux RND transporter periplasmic adaptor subunit [Acidobacteriaceae bacterium]|nr:efflux RND transporter periplasmic adaptor subunit [Acidobacteriaceae bacterium]